MSIFAVMFATDVHNAAAACILMAACRGNTDWARCDHSKSVQKQYETVTAGICSAFCMVQGTIHALMTASRI